MAVILRCYKCITPINTKMDIDGVIVNCVVEDRDLCPKSEHKLVFEAGCIAESDR